MIATRDQLKLDEGAEKRDKLTPETDPLRARNSDSRSSDGLVHNWDRVVENEL
jgi:hypothetical protein